MTYTFTPLTKEESYHLEDGDFLLYKYIDGSIAIGKLEIQTMGDGSNRYFFKHTQQPEPARFKNRWELWSWNQYSSFRNEEIMLWKLENA